MAELDQTHQLDVTNDINSGPSTESSNAIDNTVYEHNLSEPTTYPPAEHLTEPTTYPPAEHITEPAKHLSTEPLSSDTMTDNKLTPEHVVPLSNGSTQETSNHLNDVAQQLNKIEPSATDTNHVIVDDESVEHLSNENQDSVKQLSNENLEAVIDLSNEKEEFNAYEIITEEEISQVVLNERQDLVQDSSVQLNQVNVEQQDQVSVEQPSVDIEQISVQEVSVEKELVNVEQEQINVEQVNVEQKQINIEQEQVNVEQVSVDVEQVNVDSSINNSILNEHQDQLSADVNELISAKDENNEASYSDSNQLTSEEIMQSESTELISEEITQSKSTELIPDESTQLAPEEITQSESNQLTPEEIMQSESTSLISEDITQSESTQLISEEITQSESNQLTPEEITQSESTELISEEITQSESTPLTSEEIKQSESTELIPDESTQLAPEEIMQSESAPLISEDIKQSESTQLISEEVTQSESNQLTPEEIMQNESTQLTPEESTQLTSEEITQSESTQLIRELETEFKEMSTELDDLLDDQLESNELVTVQTNVISGGLEAGALQAGESNEINDPAVIENVSTQLTVEEVIVTNTQPDSGSVGEQGRGSESVESTVKTTEVIEETETVTTEPADSNKDIVESEQKSSLVSNQTTIQEQLQDSRRGDVEETTTLRGEVEDTATLRGEVEDITTVREEVEDTTTLVCNTSTEISDTLEVGHIELREVTKEEEIVEQVTVEVNQEQDQVDKEQKEVGTYQEHAVEEQKRGGVVSTDSSSLTGAQEVIESLSSESNRVGINQETSMSLEESEQQRQLNESLAGEAEKLSEVAVNEVQEWERMREEMIRAEAEDQMILDLSERIAAKVIREAGQVIRELDNDKLPVEGSNEQNENLENVENVINEITTVGQVLPITNSSHPMEEFEVLTEPSSSLHVDDMSNTVESVDVVQEHDTVGDESVISNEHIEDIETVCQTSMETCQLVKETEVVKHTVNESGRQEHESERETLRESVQVVDGMVERVFVKDVITETDGVHSESSEFIREELVINQSSLDSFGFKQSTPGADLVSEERCIEHLSDYEAQGDGDEGEDFGDQMSDILDQLKDRNDHVLGAQTSNTSLPDVLERQSNKTPANDVIDKQAEKEPLHDELSTGTDTNPAGVVSTGGASVASTGGDDTQSSVQHMKSLYADDDSNNDTHSHSLVPLPSKTPPEAVSSEPPSLPLSCKSSYAPQQTGIPEDMFMSLWIWVPLCALVLILSLSLDEQVPFPCILVTLSIISIIFFQFRLDFVK